MVGAARDARAPHATGVVNDIRSALVTGAGSGIGRALALAAARRGIAVVAADVDLAAAEATAAALRADAGAGLAVEMDVTDRASIDRARERIRAEHDPLDLLVNNAGVVFGGPFEEVDLGRHLATYQVNLLGLVAVTWAFLPDLRERPRAQVVNVASASGFVGLPFGAAYASSKWGVIGFSESLRRELPLTGAGHVGVTTVCPGYADTGMFEGARPPRTTRFLDPAALADRILDGAERNRPFVLTPWLVRVAPLLRGLVPTRTLDRVSDWFGATRSMEGWRGRRAR